MSSRVAAALSICLVATSIGFAQQTPALTIKSEARLVVIDITALDKDGNPVHGLKASDFTVTENKAPQKMLSFDEHAAAEANAAPPDLHLPQNTYTNYLAPPTRGPVNILLFDLLNTQPEHLEFAKQQMLGFLRRLPRHQQVALFTLGTELHQIQGFTEDSDVLIEAANEVNTQPNSIAKTMRQTATEITRETARIKSPKAARAITTYLLEEQAGRTDAQMAYTIAALTQLARAVAVMPGRKNLIWISDSLPFSMMNASTIGRNYHSEVRNMAALLSATRITVFPVDARGLATTNANAGVDSKEIFRDTGGYVSVGMGEINAALQTMEAYADQTGGRVFHNSNDLEGAMRKSIELGANYYSLSYKPSDGNWDGGFRKVSIKTSKPGLKLLYRNGYFAVADPLKSTGDPKRALQQAIFPFVPPSTVLLMKAEVVPPESDSLSTSISILLDPHDFQFSETPEHKKALAMRFLMVAWDEAGKSQGALEGDADPSFDETTMKYIMQHGLQVHYKMRLKAGEYTLRIGVIDRNTGKVGTLDVPLKVPPTTPQAPGSSQK